MKSCLLSLTGGLIRRLTKGPFLLLFFTLLSSFLFAQNPSQSGGPGTTSIRGRVAVGDTSTLR